MSRKGLQKRKDKESGRICEARISKQELTLTASTLCAPASLCQGLRDEETHQQEAPTTGEPCLKQ